MKRPVTKEEDTSNDFSSAIINAFEDFCHEDEENIFKLYFLTNGDFISKYSYCT